MADSRVSPIDDVNCEDNYCGGNEKLNPELAMRIATDSVISW